MVQRFFSPWPLNYFRQSDGGAIYYRHTTYTKDAEELTRADEDAAKLLALLDSGITYKSTLAITITFYRMTAWTGDTTSPVSLFQGSSRP